jgi:hypothetical protein
MYRFVWSPLLYGNRPLEKASAGPLLVAGIAAAVGIYVLILG